jgi:RHS repeat-associated protein
VLPDSNEILSIAGVVPIHDALGTVLGGVNSSGALAFQNTYDPFGGFAASGSPPSGYGRVYGMAGIEYDPTGLYHAGARYYSPILQRFLSEDPVRGKANMYLYAGNNPVTGSDVSGMAGDCPSGNCGITGGQENIPNDPSGLFALFEEILSALGLGGGSNSAPNYQRFLNAVTFGRFNGSVGLQPTNVVVTQGGDSFLNLWVYQQSTGNLYHIDVSGHANFEGTGYSGHGTGRNNPSMEKMANVGPIPQGTWNIGPSYTSPKTGPVTMNLDPCPNTRTYGRDYFRIHGDNPRHPGRSSEGCIVLPPSVRRRIAESSDRDLLVIP